MDLQRKVALGRLAAELGRQGYGSHTAGRRAGHILSRLTAWEIEQLSRPRRYRPRRLARRRIRQYMNGYCALRRGDRTWWQRAWLWIRALFR